MHASAYEVLARAASGTLSSFWLLIVIPAASGGILLLLGRRADRWGHLLGCASVGVAVITPWMLVRAPGPTSAPGSAARAAALTVSLTEIVRIAPAGTVTLLGVIWTVKPSGAPSKTAARLYVVPLEPRFRMWNVRILTSAPSRGS